MNRDEIKEKELEFLAGEYKKHPQLFKRETFIDNSKFLEKFGIFIRDKDDLPLGYIKLWPQDFIVEEISEDNQIYRINSENFFDKTRSFSTKDPTIYATLVKCGLSTIEVVKELSKILNLEKDYNPPATQIQFAGIKDKDAITSQLISFRKINIDELQKIDSPYLFLKNIYSGKGTVEIGGLKGNEFTIFVRTDSSFRERNFLKNLKNIEKEGFYNFFYLQRFGTPRLINFYWGLFILRGEYEKAVLSFLSSPGKRELLYFQKLREGIKENFGSWLKIEEILDSFPIIFQNERKIVSYLKENPKDFVGALNQIPQQIQLWLFAYGSWLFNKKLSFYFKKKVNPPQEMPLILSQDKRDWLFYKEFLRENKIFSMPLKNIKIFPGVQWKRREIKTVEKVRILQIKIIPEGVILNFTLPKAAYATTFLAHLFNLVSGLPPKNISPLPIDTKATLDKGSLEEVLNRFKDVIRPKTEDILEKLSQNK